MKRVFLALRIPYQLQLEIKKWRDDFSCLPVRWVPLSNIHITILPPWQTSKEQIEELQKQLKILASNISAFNLHFYNISYGPNLKNPRLIWVRGNLNNQLINLKEKAEKIFNQHINRSFLPHLTLARFKTYHFSSFPIKSLNEKINWTASFSFIELIESILLPTGAKYITILKEPLNNEI